MDTVTLLLRDYENNYCFTGMPKGKLDAVIFYFENYFGLHFLAVVEGQVIDWKEETMPLAERLKKNIDYYGSLLAEWRDTSDEELLARYPSLKGHNLENSRSHMIKSMTHYYEPSLALYNDLFGASDAHE